MSKPSNSPKSSNSPKASKSPARRSKRKPEPTPGFDAMQELVIPLLEQHIPEGDEDHSIEFTHLEEGRSHLYAVLHLRHTVEVLSEPFDEARTRLRLSLNGGYLHGDYPSDVLLLGNSDSCFPPRRSPDTS